MPDIQPDMQEEVFEDISRELWVQWVWYFPHLFLTAVIMYENYIRM